MTQGWQVGAWRAAEEQFANWLADKTGLKFNEQLFVGDSEDLTGKVNCAVFGILGGQDNSHGAQCGTKVWHTAGHFEGVFMERKEATDVMGALLVNLPLDLQGQAESEYPNLCRVYLSEHPVVNREKVRLTGGNDYYVTRVEVDLQVVYQANQEEE